MKFEGIEGCERFLSPGKGRGVKATKPFQVGELVFACPAYSYVLTVNERGSHCEFCFTRREGLSKCGKCKQAYYCNVDCQKGDWSMHKLECSAMCAYGENWCPSETVRLVARILIKQVRDLDKTDNEKNEMNQTDIAALHHFYSKNLDFPSNAALEELFAQVNCNGFTIEDEELSHLGSAVFPDVALMNHSCNPNVIVTYKGTLAEVRAVQKISPGEEDQAKMEIHQKLQSAPEAKEVQEMVTELLEICELSLERMGSIFVDTNVFMLHMMYQAMGVCLYMQDWDGAMKYGEKIVQPYSVHYPPYSLNVASMYLKLGRLYMGLEKKQEGVKALKEALAIMNIAFGKDHHYVAEVKKEMEAQK
ncbi:N-lysine methyltransferase SMYD2-A [Bagarius yarrelli]|uniref:[histone H3]-lysine(4) N-trimethyltransferase n=1 Tax=Bagarius yarrelli TaxID=175774 RepID=A0A556UFA2_BAGYA|nr:N-lysine methyltransferase SMYD2-A [Bagarius yarrelli]